MDAIIMLMNLHFVVITLSCCNTLQCHMKLISYWKCSLIYTQLLLSLSNECCGFCTHHMFYYSELMGYKCFDMFFILRIRNLKWWNTWAAKFRFILLLSRFKMFYECFNNWRSFPIRLHESGVVTIIDDMDRPLRKT